MKSKADSIIIVRTPQGINWNSSISELLEFIRTAFQKSDFELVTKILEDRENKKDKFEADNCELIREKLEMEEEIERLKKTVEEKDEKIVKLESDISELKRLESRVSCLEKDIASLNEQLQLSDEEIKQNDEADPEPSNESTGNQSSTRNVTKTLDDIILINDSDDEEKKIDETSPVKDASVHGGDDVSSPAGKLTDEDEVIEINPILDSSVRKRKRVVCSDDDADDDVSGPDGTKRMKSPPCDDDGVNVPAGELVADMANAGPVIRSCDEIPKRGKVDISGVNSDSSDDDEDLTDACLDNLAADPSPNSVIEISEKINTSNNRVWAHAMEMKKAFEDEDELCLNAVCALFWETESDVKPLDAERISELVKVLIDGDPNGKITKSSSELKKSRPSIVDECRKLADFYSPNLFQIYKNKKNPFFPCPKFQTC